MDGGATMICPHCQREIADYSNFCYYCGSRQSARSSKTGRRLTRSPTDQKIAGICAGFADYLDADVTLVRLVYALATIFLGIIPGIVAYLVAWMIMPVAPLPLPATAEKPAEQTAR